MRFFSTMFTTMKKYNGMRCDVIKKIEEPNGNNDEPESTTMFLVKFKNGDVKECFPEELFDEEEMSDDEIDKQDDVDGRIFELLQYFANGNIEWDIEYIGEIRDAFQHILVDVLHDQTEQEFYPYMEME